MKITLQIEPIIFEVRQKSHLSVQDIKDPEARDNARAGLDKIEEITRCVYDAFGQLHRRCSRFLARDYTVEADNISRMPGAYCFEFGMSERRAVNKAETLEGAMHNFVVQYALAKFCATVNQTERSNQHSLAALDFGNQIEELLYTKLPPRV